MSFSVPTGNFGNVFAGYGAQRMGLPVSQFVVGSNGNDILTRFLESSVMEMRGVEPTLSPSMDIQVSSNFERLLFELLGRDGVAVAETMLRFRADGSFTLERDLLGLLDEQWSGASIDDAATTAIIAEQLRRHGRADRSAHRGRARCRDGLPGRPGRADGHAGHRAPGQVPRRGRGRHRRAATAARPPRPTCSTDPSATTPSPPTTTRCGPRSSRPSPDAVPPVTDLADGLIRYDDGRVGCWWAGDDPLYRAYHDDEWGRPVTDDVRLFEKLCLEGFQAGLAWITILRKRERFREVFAGFDPEVVAAFGPADVDRLLGDRRHHPPPRQDRGHHRQRPGLPRPGRARPHAPATSSGPMLRRRRSTGPVRPRQRSRPPRTPSSRRAEQGAQATWVPLRRTDHGLRVHAGDGSGERPPRGVRRPGRADLIRSL